MSDLAPIAGPANGKGGCDRSTADAGTGIGGTSASPLSDFGTLNPRYGGIPPHMLGFLPIGAVFDRTIIGFGGVACDAEDGDRVLSVEEVPRSSAGMFSFKYGGILPPSDLCIGDGAIVFVLILIMMLLCSPEAQNEPLGCIIRCTKLKKNNNNNTLGI
jgi:hypothetical protein